MPIRWPLLTSTHGDYSDPRAAQAEATLHSFGDQIEAGLRALGLSPASSLLWQPWNLAVIWDEQNTWCAFAPNTGGNQETHYYARPGVVLRDADFVAEIITRDLYWSQVEVLRLPLPGSANEASEIANAARSYVEMMDRKTMMRRLGDLRGLEHLEPHLREYLKDHPEPTRNMFIMMRFQPSSQLIEVHNTIAKTLAARNIHAIRVDDRDYTGDLWTNLEVCITGCTYGIAVYEDIDVREYNPNVALEVGYMLARRKRVLILKEQRLPTVPSDLAGKLYKPWDSYKIEKTVGDQVTRWVDDDLRLNP